MAAKRRSRLQKFTRKLSPADRAMIKSARAQGYIPFLTATGDLGFAPRQVGAKTGRRTCYHRGRRVKCA